MNRVKGMWERCLHAIAKLWFCKRGNQEVEMSYKIIKLILDKVFSMILTLILLPILLIISCLIKIESSGSVFFIQDRLGLNGRVFKIYKFRSMIVGAEKMGTGVYSYKNDQRITKIGRILRKTSLDELPQLFNILKGDMSFIGPRPTLTYHPWPFEEYTHEQKRRFSVRPGVTGWAQVNGRKDVPWDRRIEFDVEYVENLSFTFDLKIIFQTIAKIISMKDNENVRETVQSNIEKTNISAVNEVLLNSIRDVSEETSERSIVK